MSVPTKKVDFIGGKITETPTNGVAVEIVKLKDVLVGAKETIHDNFTLDPMASGIINIGNIDTAKVLALVGTDTFSARINGSDPNNFKTFVAFGTEITSLVITNPSVSDSISVELYGATDD